MGFPASPGDGEYYTNPAGTKFRYIAAEKKWRVVGGPTYQEVSDAENIGTGGVGIYKEKALGILKLKKINGSTQIGITDDTGNDEVDIGINTESITDNEISPSANIAQSKIEDLTTDLSNIKNLTDLFDPDLTSSERGCIVAIDQTDETNLKVVGLLKFNAGGNIAEWINPSGNLEVVLDPQDGNNVSIYFKESGSSRGSIEYQAANNKLYVRMTSGPIELNGQTELILRSENGNIKMEAPSGQINSYANIVMQDSKKVTGLPTPTDDSDATNKAYVDQLINGLDWQESVLDRVTAPIGGETGGERYLVITTATGDFTGEEDSIAEYNGTSWDFYTPTEGFACLVEDENTAYIYITGSGWVKIASIQNHNDLANIQGGASGDRYHLTQARLNTLTYADASIDNADGEHKHAHSATTGITVNDHHNQVHELNGTDHSVAGGTLDWTKVNKTGSKLDDIGDVNIPTPTDGDMIIYDGATSKWVSHKCPFSPIESSVIAGFSEADIGGDYGFVWEVSSTDSDASINCRFRVPPGNYKIGISYGSSGSSSTNPTFDIYANDKGVGNSMSSWNLLNPESATPGATVADQIYNYKTAQITVTNGLVGVRFHKTNSLGVGSGTFYVLEIVLERQ